MMKHGLSRWAVGSLLVMAAGCAAEPEPSNEAAARAPERGDKGGMAGGKGGKGGKGTTAGNECEGAAVDAPKLSGELTIDAATGLATTLVRNAGAAPIMVEVSLHTRDPRGALVRTTAPGISVMPGQASPVRIAVGDVDGAELPTHLKAELVARAADGSIVERAFAHAYAGPSIADTAGRLGLPVSATIEGEPVKLAAITAGGPGLDPLTIENPHDVLEEGEITAPPLPPPALAYDMCFRWPVTLIDAGFGEDFGTNPTSPWVARGGRVSIVQAGQTLFDGYLDDTGCTGAFAATGSTNFSIFGYSRARIAGNDLIVRDAEGLTRSFVIWDADPGMNQNPIYVFPEVEAVSTLLAVSAYTLQKFHSGMTGRTIPVENRCRPIVNGCCNCASGDGIWVDDDDRKFLIAHEMGHRLLSLYMGGYDNDVSFDLDPTDMALLCDTSAAHSMWSLEFESGAAMEGWAHFISVASFNSRQGTNPGAMMRYWSGDGVDVDVEQGPTGGASNYLENVCPSVAVSTKLAVQLDWLRHWWDYYSNDTDVDPGYRPSVTRMMDELDAAPTWDAGDAWDKMRAGVKAHSGDTQQARWDQHGAWNGID